MTADAGILSAIRKTVGESEFWPGDLIDRCAGMRAKDHKELCAALDGQFNALQLGHWLKRQQGAICDGWRLCAEWKRSRKGPGPRLAWVYRFEDVNELGENGILCRELTEGDDRFDRCATLSRKCTENTRQLEKLEEREEERKAEAQLAKESAKFQQNIEDTRKVLTRSVMDRSTGLMREEAVYDPRTGEPVREPAPAAAVAAPPSELKPTQPGRCPAHGNYCCGHRLTKAEAAAAHKQYEGAVHNQRGSVDWFVNACNARNARLYE